MNDEDAEVHRLERAPFEIVGRFADASNATLLARLTDRDPRSLTDLAGELGRAPQPEDLPADDLAVHKPRRGEAPLWDFPDGTLHRREVAAYEVSRALGWGLVPPTVVSRNGAFGPGSLQRFVPHDPAEHYFTLLEREEPSLLAQLRAMVVFDLVIDNADRKGGHVLLETTTPGATGKEPRIRLVDHGVSFHVEGKLRTVAWDFVGETVPIRLREQVGALAGRLDDDLGHRLTPLLSPPEIDALRARIEAVAALDRFPAPSGRRPYPWPLV